MAKPVGQFDTFELLIPYGSSWVTKHLLQILDHFYKLFSLMSFVLFFFKKKGNHPRKGTIVYRTGTGMQSYIFLSFTLLMKGKYKKIILVLEDCWK